MLTLSGQNNNKVEEPCHDGMQGIRSCKENLLFLRRKFSMQGLKFKRITARTIKMI